ncbi:hypothetical protein QWI84_03735, partial [Acinetobacter baumannii]|uniref:hypothetical protein n=1 Tax=Acinetobacter baumannii TaxID=470 RepID=UPI00274206AB
YKSIFFLYNTSLFKNKKIVTIIQITARNKNGETSPVSTSDFDPENKTIKAIEIKEKTINKN